MLEDVCVYMICNNATIRQACKDTKVSRASLHRFIANDLELINRILYREVKAILEKNKIERCKNGGLSSWEIRKEKGKLEIYKETKRYKSKCS